MAALTIAPVERLAFKASASVFLAVFGGLWLMLEPLVFFGILPALHGLNGALAYLGMFAIAVFAVAMSTRIYQFVARSKLTFVTFIVVSATEGSEYQVRAPKACRYGTLLVAS